jgi:anti-sigma factor ChrR (cupin superfamily)
MQYYCDNQDRASLYALGLLDEAESRTFEQHLGSCPVCAAEVRESGDIAVRLAGTIPASAPPEGLRQRVLSETTLPRGVAALVRGAQLNWQPTSFEGVSMARLYEDPVRGELASLVRMKPGTRFPSHQHAALEHCYVVEGDLIFEDHSMTAGDYSAGKPDSEHAAATTNGGCVLFIVHHADDQVRVH